MQESSKLILISFVQNVPADLVGLTRHTLDIWLAEGWVLIQILLREWAKAWCVCVCVWVWVCVEATSNTHHSLGWRLANAQYVRRTWMCPYHLSLPLSPWLSLSLSTDNALQILGEWKSDVYSALHKSTLFLSEVLWKGYFRAENDRELPLLGIDCLCNTSMNLHFILYSIIISGLCVGFRGCFSGFF